MGWMIEDVKVEVERMVVERFVVRKGYDSNMYFFMLDIDLVVFMQVGYGGSQFGVDEFVRRLGVMDDIIVSFGGMRVSVEEQSVQFFYFCYFYIYFQSVLGVFQFVLWYVYFNLSSIKLVILILNSNLMLCYI